MTTIALPVVSDVAPVGVPGAFSLLVSACDATLVGGDTKYPGEPLATIVT